ncbi:GTPase Era [Schaalia sp. lx-100]|uniref:GTPase Era n=1 Tax=Schaalia sp. lx-100 TaxID=2899081 RepID=UPI001E5C53AE|nr:GTPase Era [Schaalia sp. lx-100]MCD4558016.1 GTPase Era [Schaalia sp. lx-100]
MYFPSDDELMAGPNAFDEIESEGIDSSGYDGESENVSNNERAYVTGFEADTHSGDGNEWVLDEEHERIRAEEHLAGLRELKKETQTSGLLNGDFPEDFRAGFVSIVGRPNVGKSTLTNALVGQKVAITSGRPETTRHNIRGIVHRPHAQLVLVDTPGYHRPRTLLGKRLNDMVREALAEVDCVVFCMPANQKIGPGDQFIARELRDIHRPVIAVATKCDTVPRQRVMKHLMSIERLGDWAAIVPVSSHEGRGIDILMDVLTKHVPQSPPLYPLDGVTDESRDTLIAEFIREAALEGVHDELPHSLAVQVEEIIERPARPGDTRPPLLDIHVNVYVERDSQKAIIIGRKGARLKHIGTQARTHIEELLGRRVYLDLHVRTAKDWQSDPKMLGRLGF